MKDIDIYYIKYQKYKDKYISLTKRKKRKKGKKGKRGIKKKSKETSPFDKINLLSNMLLKKHTTIVEQQILNIFLEVKGEKLTLLKQKLDYQFMCVKRHVCIDMNEIVYDLINEKNRENLLTHFWENQDFTRYIHILTDVDDTLFPNPVFPGGSDHSYIPKKFYPDVINFHSALQDTPYVTLLSARPKMMEQKMREPTSKIRQSLKKISILTGPKNIKELLQTGRDVISLKRQINAQDKLPESIEIYKIWGNRKVNSFNEFKNIYPEYDLVFIGDTGQGDVYAAVKMLQKTKRMVALMHNVKDSSGEFTYQESKIPRIYPFAGVKTVYRLDWSPSDDDFDGVNYKDLNLFFFENYTDMMPLVPQFKQILSEAEPPAKPDKFSEPSKKITVEQEKGAHLKIKEMKGIKGIKKDSPGWWEWFRGGQ